ncbi:MAG: SDR family oxidoreductase [Phenylobacterium sp.]|uniref:SDR family oxidoreductase n=1 Tax=Phenylobacterium sp. TaxID=1871053 RepID=UPI0027376E04|nr:SDR family oxidoreductase [Phenylobacterium sp.]MDP3174701.1 SDR family oxidoreductase [Phenylobacterium sp.]
MHVKLKPLSQQVIVITGASSGIGLATARMAVKAGAAVVLTSRNDAALRRICDELNAAGGRTHPVVGDVGDPEDVGKIARAAIARFGGFDTWVNDAGVGVYGELADLDHADHEQLFRTNYFGVVNGSMEAIKHLRTKRGGGALINVGSVLSDVAAPMLGAYSASKHAVKGFTDALRMELRNAKAPVSVTLIKPSSINSPFADHARNNMDKPARVPPPVYTPEVVAEAILYAAQHPVRDITVGGAGRQISLAGGAAPGVADRVFSALLPNLSKRSGVKSSGDNLYGPGDDGEVRTSAYRGRGFSVYTQSRQHPALTAAVGGLIVAGVAAYFARGVLSRTARPAIARAVRPFVLRAALRKPMGAARFAVRHPRQAAKIAKALR